MIKWIFILILLSVFYPLTAQEQNLNNGWNFIYQNKKYAAEVPGNIYTDLLRHRLIPDPFYGRNERVVSWVDTQTWVYALEFRLQPELKGKRLTLQFAGLDTRADILLNGRKLGTANNMFRQWEFDVSNLIQTGQNTLQVRFTPADVYAREEAQRHASLTYPDHPRVMMRKAAYQFGWDWGPTLRGAGIWKDVKLIVGDAKAHSPIIFSSPLLEDIRFHRERDSIGESFYFSRRGEPIYIRGANWIPADVFPTRLSREDYRFMLETAKYAGIDMLRVWGGGIYESDSFYSLCDSLGIMVWQDLMFAGGMYPADSSFLTNVKQEIDEQVRRLSRHPCIVLWCGNNEVDEAWHHWGWQQSFHLHGADSAKVWQEYTTLFQDSLPEWIQHSDTAQRPYISTSPQYGWGEERSITEGDSHYWGFWWGYQGWEIFRQKTGRFVSEWGMQALPTYPLLQKMVDTTINNYFNPDLKWHQKATEGNQKLHHYMHTYMFDTARLATLDLRMYDYLSQCTQYYLIENVIATQRNQFPRNMGTLLWQYNDCWPAISWSVTDYDRSPKGGWYAMRRMFADSLPLAPDTTYPKQLPLESSEFKLTQLGPNRIKISATSAARFVYLYTDERDLFLSDNYFNLAPGEEKIIEVAPFERKGLDATKVKVLSWYDLQH